MTQQELRKQWETRVRDFRASGQSAVSWCSDHQLKTHQLGYWVKQYEQPRESSSSPCWISVQVDENTCSQEDTITVRLGTATIDVKPGFNEKLLADVVRTLHDLC